MLAAPSDGKTVDGFPASSGNFAGVPQQLWTVTHHFQPDSRAPYELAGLAGEPSAKADPSG